MSGIQKQWLSKEEFEKRQGGSWTPSPHTHVKTDITDTPWVWGDVSKTGSNLTDLATRQHAGLTNVTSDQHHPQSHTLASHSTKPHSALTDVTESQHHNKLHSMTGVQHSAAGLTIGHVIRASGAAAFAWAQLQHGDLGGVTSDLHHAQLHAASHLIGGGDPLSVGVPVNIGSSNLAGTATNFVRRDHVHAHPSGLGDSLHHNKLHALTGTQHTAAGLTIGWVIRATGATTFAWGALIAADLPSHDIISKHSAAGLTTGHVLKATGASAFAFQANNLGGLSDLNLGSLEHGETIMHDSPSGKWIDTWGVEYDNPRLVWKFYTDFGSAGNNSNDPWVGATVINGTLSARPGEDDHPGIIRLNSTASIHSGYRFMTATNCILLGGAENTEFVFKTPISLTDGEVRLGFQDSLNDTLPTDGVYLHLIGTKFRGRAVSNGSMTATSAYYLVSTSTWYRGKIALSTDKATATFWLYSEAGQQLWSDTVTSNIPTATGRETGHGIVAWINSASGKTLIELDMMIASRAGTITR